MQLNQVSHQMKGVKWETRPSALVGMLKVMNWNTRGLNGLNKQKEVKIFCNEQEVGLIGLLETKIKADKVEKIFYATFVYAFNLKDDRKPLWDYMQQISSNYGIPWIALGDFNFVLHQEHRIGGNAITLTEVINFQNCLDVCKLAELPKPNTGCQYTWSDKKDSREFLEIVADGWNAPIVGYKMYQVVRKLKGLKKKLQELHKKSYNNILVEVNLDWKLVMQAQENLQKSPMDPVLQATEAEKRKATWIRLSDDKTEYFFSVIKQRKLIQSVIQITNEHNQTQHDLKRIAYVFIRYYEQMLGEKGDNRRKASVVFLKQGPMLATKQKFHILRRFTAAEVKKAMFSTNINKSPGPDGFGTGFYRDAWSVIGNDVTEEVLEFLHNRQMLKQLNATLITLIPKDLLRHYGRKTTARCLMKIDPRKAYDMVEWGFIEEMLKGYGFLDKFTKLIMTCVTTSRFSVKVNGEGWGYFEGKGGLRQGDPLSPLLFVMVMEYLTRVLHKMEELPDFRYHPMCKV
ncbi:uncharacterized protein LOC132612270 [Lycium barbarum]|uniref:uncharacterized protein LOC132612270 n=1 Tax=Lycium barbarum TaxID=112863 RepID=UPI00293EDC8E|nr:uncharacterized protein LOC132612270 [Lycium barbarum]